jgi:hypothetical protein
MTDPIDAQAAGSDALIGSKQKAKNGYGQNGYQGPSSDLPGQSTRMDRDYGLPADPSADAGDWQTRKVDQTPITTHPGMKARDNKISFPTNNVRAATKRAMGGNYQR